MQLCALPPTVNMVNVTKRPVIASVKVDTLVCSAILARKDFSQLKVAFARKISQLYVAKNIMVILRFPR